MLHQISWSAYVVILFFLVTLYYLCVGLTLYRNELKTVLLRLAGRQPALQNAGTSDLHIPDAGIMGRAAPENVDFVSPEELAFGPADESETLPATNTVTGPNNRLIASFSEMVSEVQTLIRVINESSESKENFEMLFRLIIQKYPGLAGTAYQQQINDFLLTEGIPEFPFPLSETELNDYWTEEN